MHTGVKLVRRGKAIDAEPEYPPYPNAVKISSINIMLKKELAPEPYPQHHSFCIYHGNCLLYLSLDTSLPDRYEELVGQTVLIEYFSYSEQVLLFEE